MIIIEVFSYPLLKLLWGGEVIGVRFDIGSYFAMITQAHQGGDNLLQWAIKLVLWRDR